MGKQLQFLLQEYNLPDKSSLLEFFLAQLEGKSVIEQLKQQKIRVITKAPLFMAWALLIIRDDGFLIELDESASPEEWVDDVAHELCHTFFFDLSQSPPRPKFGPRLEFGKGSQEKEDICDEFASQWIKQGSNKIELKKLLQRTLSKKEALWL